MDFTNLKTDEFRYYVLNFQKRIGPALVGIKAMIIKCADYN